MSFLCGFVEVNSIQTQEQQVLSESFCKAQISLTEVPCYINIPLNPT